MASLALLATFLIPASALAQSGGLQNDIGNLNLPKTQGITLDQIRTFVINGINFFLAFIVVFAVLMGLVGGYKILFSAGKEDAYKQGLTYLKNAAIAIAIVFGIGIVLNTILNLLSNNSFLTIFGG